MTVADPAPQIMDPVDHVADRLENPMGADVEAFKDSLRLFRDIQACDDPQLKAGLANAMQVRAKSRACG